MDATPRIFAVSLVIAGAALAGAAAISTEPPAHIEIVASGEVHARVRRCGCQGEPKAPPTRLTPAFGTCSCKSVAMPPGTPLDLGAFPERSAYLAAVGGEPLLVDAGDLFFPHLDPMDFERAEWQRRAELLVDIEDRQKLAAFTPGELDLALGRGALEALAQRAHFAFVAANLLDARTHAPVFKTRAVFERDGVRIGVTGIVAPPASDATTKLLAAEGLELGDPEAAARAEAAALRGEGCRIVVLLAHAPDVRARAIGRAARSMDVVIESHGEVPTNAESLIEDGTAYPLPYPGGGVARGLRIDVVPGATGVADDEARVETTAKLERWRAQLAEQVRERSHVVSPDRARELDQQIAFVESKLKQLEATVDKTPRHAFVAQGIALHARDWKKGQDKFVLDAIEHFKTDVDKLALDAATVERIETPGKTANDRPLAYATETTCATCHKLQASVWAASKHAHAWADLEKSESQKDPDCVRCHSIGFRQPGGFAEPRRVTHDGQDYRNVQCESCHGARQAHTLDPRGSGVGVHLPDMRTCQRCHDGEHDSAFTDTKFREAFTRPDKICVKGLP